MAAVPEQRMSDRTVVAADQVSAADFIVAYTLDSGDTAQLLGGFPRLQAHLQRMCARPRPPPIRDLLADL